MERLEKIEALFDKMLDAGILCCAVLVFLAWLVTCLEIFCRQFFNHPLVWTVEAAEFMMLYVLFLGAAWVLRVEEHIQVDILIELLKPRTRTLLTAFNSVLGIIVSATLVWYGASTTMTHYRDGIRTFTAMELPQWPFLLAIPIGSFFLLLQFCMRFRANLVKFRGHGPMEEECCTEMK